MQVPPCTFPYSLDPAVIPGDSNRIATNTNMNIFYINRNFIPCCQDHTRYMHITIQCVASATHHSSCQVPSNPHACMTNERGLAIDWLKEQGSLHSHAFLSMWPCKVHHQEGVVRGGLTACNFCTVCCICSPRVLNIYASSGITHIVRDLSASLSVPPKP